MGVCINVTLNMFDLCQYYVCSIRSDVTNGPSTCCSTCAECASAIYTWCSGRTSVYLYDTSLQNLALTHLIPISLFPWSDLGDSVFDGVEVAGFKIRANAFLLAQATCVLLLWVLIVGLGFLD